MAVLVSGVGALIHIYSLGYMRDDQGKSRYFAALSLFMFAMLGIVFANNFVMLFIFWELVGFTSYVWSVTGSFETPQPTQRQSIHHTRLAISDS